jgi:hypothetical protein
VVLSAELTPGLFKRTLLTHWVSRAGVLARGKASSPWLRRA